ncbi:MAG: DUF4404 family protein [Planctomycetota bacterium]
MTDRELNEALEAVHEQLSEADHLDPSDVEKLRTTMNEIQSVLDSQERESESLSERVSHSAKRFEESHPVLTDTLGRIADMLQQMGI